jgi:hypothetical protein
MEAIATQLAALQKQLSEVAESQTAMRATQSAQGAALATLAAAVGHSTGPAAGEGSQQQLQRPQKLVRVDKYASPFDKDVVLDAVFSYVGIGDYIYTGAVCRRWKDRYIKLCYSTTPQQPLAHKLCTSHKSAIMTAATLQLALDSKLKMDDLQRIPYRLACMVIKHSFDARGVLSLARIYGLDWSEHYTSTASRAQQLELLQWLYGCGCPTEFSSVIYDAVHSDDVDTLVWTRSAQAVTWDSALLQSALVQAG